MKGTKTMGDAKGQRPMIGCPVCGGKRLRIDVIFSGSVACEFYSDSAFELCETASLDSHWHDGSECECEGCGWKGCVGEARDKAHLGNAQASLELDLLQLEKEIEAGSCPREIAGPAMNLIKAVRKLRVQVDLLERINNSLSRQDGAGNPSDTALF